MSSDNWCSPPEVDAGLWELNDGPVDCDPCSNERSIIRAHTTYATGGLVLPWNPRRRRKAKTYENPPYSNLLAWTLKGLYELGRASGPAELVRLVPVATSTAWWRHAVLAEGEPARRVPRPLVIFTRRIAFIDETNTVINGARFDAALFFYFVHDRARRIRQALRAFRSLTSWHREAS